MMKVGIIGAGIAGLVTACYLRRLGYEVTVYERNNGLSEAGAGVQVPPNALRLLTRLGLFNALSQVAFEPHGVETKRYDNGEVLQTIPVAPVAERVYGAKHFLIHRPAYQRILYDASVAAGAKIVFDARIQHVNPQTPAITFENGDTEDFDLIIGADGVNSPTRETIHPSSRARAVRHAHRAYRALIPSSLMTTTPHGTHLLTSPVITNWIGPHRHVVGYPISSTAYNLVLCHPRPPTPPSSPPPSETSSSPESWTQPGSLPSMHATYADFDPALRSVLSLINDVRAWQLAEAPEMDTWASPNGRVVLVGDSAHAMLPYAAQGGAMAVEDAAVLAVCLEHFNGSGNENGEAVKKAVDLYVKLRKPRTDRMMEAGRINGELWGLEDGEKQKARDRMWKVIAERMARDRAGGKAGEEEVEDRVDMLRKEQQLALAWMLGTDVEMDARAFLEKLDAEQRL